LANNPSKALRTAAVLVLRRMKDKNIALFLKDQDEYIVTEAARGINDDLSIPAALPALAAILKEERFTSEALLRRAINAALRVSSEKEIDMVIDFARRTNISDEIKAEALATIGTWSNPSVLDRVDGRFRGRVGNMVEGNIATMRVKIEPYIATFLQEKNPKMLVAVADLLVNLRMDENNEQLANTYAATTDNKVKIAMLRALSVLKYKNSELLIKNAMEDADATVRTAALGLLNVRSITKENLPPILQSVFTKGSVKEQQQLLVVMRNYNNYDIQPIWEDLIAKMKDKKISPDLMLELSEGIKASGSAQLKAQLAAIQPEKSLMSEYADVLYGGDKQRGYWIFTYDGTAQCGRCHAVKGDGANVGPDLTHIGSQLTREQILQALIEPSVRISPGYGNVTLKLKDGQEVFGVLLKETETALTLKTSNAEPLIIPTARIEKRENTPSSMPALGLELSKREVRDVVAYLDSLK
jgi:putative heme-binding domain-containing protein